MYQFFRLEELEGEAHQLAGRPFSLTSVDETCQVFQEDHLRVLTKVYKVESILDFVQRASTALKWRSVKSWSKIFSN
jgi:hypothetical protein